MSEGLEGIDPKVRAYIEDHLLTVSGYRNSESVDNAIAAGLTMTLIGQLVERRLIRYEPKADAGGGRLELIHDRLTGVVRASRDLRRGIEKANRAAEEKLELQKANEARRTKWFAVVLAILLVLAAGSAWRAQVERGKAEKAREEADQLRKEAETKARSAIDLGLRATHSEKDAQTERDNAVQGEQIERGSRRRHKSKRDS